MIEEILANIVPEGKVKNALRRVKYRNLIKDMNEVDVIDSGTKSDLAWIEVAHVGKVYGYRSTERHKKLQELLKDDKISKECFSVLKFFVDSYANTDNFEKEKYKQIEDGDFIVEVGSCLGHYTLKLSEKVGRNGQVVSIEADPSNYKILEKNVRENKLNNVDTYNLAIGNKEGHVNISVKEGPKTKNIGLDNLSTENSTEIKKLDEVLADWNREIDLLVVTVNGWEASALKSANLDEIRNIVSVAESNQKGVKNEGIFTDYLQDQGFNVKIEEEELGRICYASKTGFNS